jgi:predicted dehydrogenase
MEISRRDVLISLGVGSAAWPLSRAPAADKPRPLRLGLIGAGSRGKELVRQFERVPDGQGQGQGSVRVVAACDVYQPRFAELGSIARGPVEPFTDYRKLLERRDLDAVAIATPIYLHREHVVAALDAGFPVYGEKSFGHTVVDSDAILAAVERNKRPFQVGHQYRYATWFRTAVDRIKAGAIGRVTQVQAFWHRNSSWRRPVPAGPDGRVDPALERLINWRLYRAYSGGLLAELGSHATDFANWVFESMPESVVGSGGIDYYRDGRETHDNVKAMFRYPGGQTFIFSALTSNSHMGFQVLVHGDKGSIMLSQDEAVFMVEKHLADAYFKSAAGGGKPARPRARRLRDATDSVTGASYRPGTETPGSPQVAQIWRDRTGPHADVTHDACRAFCQTLRDGTPVFADARVGWASATAVALANLAVDQGRRIDFKDYLKKT